MGRPLPRFTVGIDLATVEEVADSIARFGQRFLQRVFTDAELRECAADTRRLAGHLAAKEAAMKALAPAPDEPLPWQSISVISSPHGLPSIRLTGRARALAQRRGITQLDVSLTREGTLAAAVVIARRGGYRIKEER